MPELLKALLVSASLGALLGLERQWSGQRENPKADTIAGARTFALWGALGTLCAWFSREHHEGFFLAGFIAMVVLVSLFLFRRAQHDRDIGLTTGAVGLTTYLLGGLVFYDQVKTAVVVAVSLVVLLASKDWLHRLSSKFSRQDVYQALQFAAVTGIVLPLVPDRPYGPYDAFNPFNIWLMVVLVSGLGFAGYLAVRIFGEDRGLAMTGLLGGLASSTATTLAMSRQSRAQPETGRLCALAVVLACTVMLARVAILLGAVSPPLLGQTAPWLLLVALPGLAFAAWSWRHFQARTETVAAPAEVRNPLSLRIAIQFAILYALIVLLVRWAQAGFGGAGLYTASFLSGLTDLDAISLSLSQLQRDGDVGMDVATRAVLIAAGANSLLKAGMAVSLGSPAMRRPVALVLGATVLVAALAARLA
ncbi:MAG: MgtC/SapB family protein [Chthoniobacterales bacterium]